MKAGGLSQRARLWERLWASSVLLYSVAATFIVWKALRQYGVNPVIFFIIDASTSWIYGISSARLVMRIIAKDWQNTRKWALAAGISFVTPQIYILVSARHAPREVYLIVIGVILALTLFAAITLLFELRRGKKLDSK